MSCKPDACLMEAYNTSDQGHQNAEVVTRVTSKSNKL